MKINVKELIKTEFAIKEEKGNVLYEKLKKILSEENEYIVLDFSDITASTTRFFNVSISKLYSDFPFDTIDSIKITNANKVIESQLEVSKNGAKEFYRNKKL